MDNYTEMVIKAVTASKVISDNFKISYIGSEQLLYGLLYCDVCEAAKLLSKYGVTKTFYFSELKKEISLNFKYSGFTPNAKHILQEATEIAYGSGVSYVATEHILYAILKNADCKACMILRRMTPDIELLKEDAEKLAYPRRNRISRRGISERELNSRYIGTEIGTETSRVVKSSAFDNARSSGANDINIGSRARTDDNDGRNEAKVCDSVTESENGSPLDGFGEDLTEKAKSGKLDPVIGREEETERVIRTLSRRTKNSPVLVGEAGVGKSAVVEGLAMRMAIGTVPDILSGKKIFSLDMAGMIAGSKYRGEFEERFKNAINYVLQCGSIILFIDEIHNLVGAGATSDSKFDAAEMLKPLLARGDLQVIGATTYDEYTKYIEHDPALERRFQPITVNPPSVSDAIEILYGLRDKYEAHHKVEITDDAVKAAVTLSERYITDRNLPDKAIDLIDEAAARARLKATAQSAELLKKNDEIKRLYIERDYCLNRSDMTELNIVDSKLMRAKNELRALENSRVDARSSLHPFIGAEDVAEIISEWTHIPLSKITGEESRKLLSLEQQLHKRVIGQNDAISAVSRAIRRARAGMKDPKRPIGSFIFAGPTGVGKTELSKALAEAVFGDENALIRIDMSEYMEKYAASKLIGAPPGLVGYDEEGQLTEKVRRKPYSVVLFDEIEKAHPDIFNLMLQILDDGRLTDSKGRTVDFKNTIIIMTSNVGAAESEGKQTAALGFGAEKSQEQARREIITRALQKTFRPEFLNRVDEIITFVSLSKKECAEIASLLLDSLAKRLVAINISLCVEDSAKEHIINEGYDEKYGARPLKRVIQKDIEDMLSDGLISGKIVSGNKLTLFAADGKIAYRLTV